MLRGVADCGFLNVYSSKKENPLQVSNHAPASFFFRVGLKKKQGRKRRVTSQIVAVSNGDPSKHLTCRI